MASDPTAHAARPVPVKDNTEGIRHSIAHLNIRDASGSYMKPLALLGSSIPGASKPAGIKAPTGKAQGANVNKAAGNRQSVWLKNLINRQGN